MVPGPGDLFLMPCTNLQPVGGPPRAGGRLTMLLDLCPQAQGEKQARHCRQAVTPAAYSWRHAWRRDRCPASDPASGGAGASARPPGHHCIHACAFVVVLPSPTGIP